MKIKQNKVTSADVSKSLENNKIQWQVIGQNLKVTLDLIYISQSL